MFWKNFFDLCESKGMSPNAVAAELGYSSGSVSAWKTGRVPKWSTVKKLADYFGVSVDKLLGAESSVHPKKATLEEDILKDEFEKKLIKTFRETTVDGKIKIINAAEEIKASIEKNNLSGDQHNA